MLLFGQHLGVGNTIDFLLSHLLSGHILPNDYVLSLALNLTMLVAV